MKIYIPKKHIKTGKDYMKASEMSEQTAKDVVDYQEKLKSCFWNQFMNLCQNLELHDFPPMGSIESMIEHYKKNEKEDQESIQ